MNRSAPELLGHSPPPFLGLDYVSTVAKAPAYCGKPLSYCQLAFVRRFLSQQQPARARCPSKSGERLSPITREAVCLPKFALASRSHGRLSVQVNGPPAGAADNKGMPPFQHPPVGSSPSAPSRLMRVAGWMVTVTVAIGLLSLALNGGIESAPEAALPETPVLLSPAPDDALSSKS